MYKIIRTDKGVQLFNTLNYYDTFELSWTDWEIVKAIKKYGKEKASDKLSLLFNISKKEAKEDIEIVLINLKKLGVNIDFIPSSVSNVKHSPRTVHFDITPKCNSKCLYCLSSDIMANKKELPLKNILDVISELPSLGTWILLISGGEPLMRKDLFKILEHADKLDILTQLLTNGTLINNSIAKKLASIKRLFLQISLDSCIPKHHDFHRGITGSYEKTLKGIELLKKNGLTPEIGMVITKYNLEDINDTASFLYKLGIKHVRIGPVVTYRGKGLKNEKKFALSVNQLQVTGKKIIELNKKYSGKMVFSPTREFVIFSVIASKTEKLTKCSNGSSIVYIAPDGLVYPCIGTAHPEFVIGDIKKETLTKIWKTSYLLKKIRYLSTDDIKKCKNCKFKDLCSGGCRADSYKYFGKITEHDPLYCAYFRNQG